VDGDGAVLAVPVVDVSPRPRGGGLVGAGVEAAGGVEGTAPPNSPPPPNADVVDEEEDAAVPVPNTVVVLFPQVTTPIRLV
jgi:hypothetical protein